MACATIVGGFCRRLSNDAFDERGVTFRWKDYRAKGRTRHKIMTLETGEFMRRFLLHVLPAGFHRIRHYGLLANPVRRASLAKARELLDVMPEADTQPDAPGVAIPAVFVCRHCGAPMIVIEPAIVGRVGRQQLAARTRLEGTGGR